MAGLLFRIEAQSKGGLKVCRSAADIRDAIGHGAFASVFHIEGVEAFDADLEALYVLFTRWPAHARSRLEQTKHLRYGVPFRFPSSPDIGPGLTEAGRRLVKTCNDSR